MARARQRAEWERTAEVLAMTYNMLRDPAKSRFRGSELFNPYRSRSKPKPLFTTANMDVLRVFIDGQIPPEVIQAAAEQEG